MPMQACNGQSEGVALYVSVVLLVHQSGKVVLVGVGVFCRVLSSLCLCHYIKCYVRLAIFFVAVVGGLSFCLLWCVALSSILSGMFGSNCSVNQCSLLISS